jgi:hypothetical protein
MVAGLGAFPLSGEPLALHGLEGSCALLAFPETLGLRGFLAPRFSSPLFEFFTEESGSMSCGALHRGRLVQSKVKFKVQ